MTIAATARANALQVEAKKHALRQQQDGCWILTMKVHANDMPDAIMKASMGQRYICALVAIDDNELPVNQQQEVQHTSSPKETPETVTPTPQPDKSVSVPAEDGGRKAKSPAQISGYLCTTVPFQKFLREKFPGEWEVCECQGMNGVAFEATASAVVRELCQVDSRADIKPDNTEWNALLLSYKLWERHPELDELGAA